MIIIKDEENKVTDDTNAMGLIFVLTALNKKGETALKNIYAQKDTKQEKVIMTKGQILTHDEKRNPPDFYSIWFKFTNAALLLRADKRLSGKFEPFTVANVISKLLEGLKSEGVSLLEVEIEVIKDATEKKGQTGRSDAGILTVQKKRGPVKNKRVVRRTTRRPTVNKKGKNNR